MNSPFSRDFNVIYTRVVQGCNLNCSHCFTLGDQDPIGLTSLELIQRYYRVLRQRLNPEKAVFYIHGGETFLAPLDYLATVNRYIRETFDETKIDIIPQTNLTYAINDEWIEFIRREYRATIGVSWDAAIRFRSASQETRFFNNLRRLLDAGINVHIAITVQKHLLERDPLEVVAQFEGVSSIDFELLTYFDAQTASLRVNNERWSQWLDTVVAYYQTHPTSWALPMADLLTQSIQKQQIHDCKCNCCDRRTFTLNPNGTVGLCPDTTYITPLATVTALEEDWAGFEARAVDVIVGKLADAQLHENCYSCEHYEYCGGNCESSLFDDTDECPLSKRVFSRIRENLPVFVKLYEDRALPNLTELRRDYEQDH